MLLAQLFQHPLLFLLTTTASVLTFLRRHKILAKIAAEIPALARKMKRTKAGETRREELIETTTELAFNLQKHSTSISFSRHSIHRSKHPQSSSKGDMPDQTRLRQKPERESKRRISVPEGNGGLR
jgi:hypothetical protein